MSGSIDEDKKVTQLGYEYIIGGDVFKKEGKISLKLPNETRKEAMDQLEEK
ncbi:hypothetical protein D3C76_1709250 [compost metagenome]